MTELNSSKQLSKQLYNSGAFQRNKSAVDLAYRFCYEIRNYLYCYQNNFEFTQVLLNQCQKYSILMYNVMEGKHKHSHAQQKIIDTIAQDEVYHEVIIQLNLFSYELQGLLIQVLCIMLSKDQNEKMKLIFINNKELLDICLHCYQQQSNYKILGPLLRDLVKIKEIHEIVCTMQNIAALDQYIRQNTPDINIDSLQSLIDILAQFQFPFLKVFLNENAVETLKILKELVSGVNYQVKLIIFQYFVELIQQHFDVGQILLRNFKDFLLILENLMLSEKKQVKYCCFKLLYYYFKYSYKQNKMITKYISENAQSFNEIISAFQFDQGKYLYLQKFKIIKRCKSQRIS